MTETHEFGIVGFGKIGQGLSRQALEKGMRVVGFDIASIPRDLQEAGLAFAIGAFVGTSTQNVDECWRVFSLSQALHESAVLVARAPSDRARQVRPRRRVGRV